MRKHWSGGLLGVQQSAVLRAGAADDGQRRVRGGGGAFHQLGEYEDSAEYALYAAALDALQRGKIDLARANLLEIAPFKSADRYLRYLDALDAENEGELDSALDIYASLGSFEDCAERAQTLEAAIPEQAIRQGRQMMSQGDYEGARDLFLS